MNMAAWATRLIPFGMQEGYIHHAEGADVQMWNRGTTAMDGRRSEARVNLKRDSSSWKDEMRKGRHEDADKCSQPALGWVGLGLGRQSSATTAPWSNKRRL